jgi:ABC-type multidrug transport system ATPase subunit
MPGAAQGNGAPISIQGGRPGGQPDPLLQGLLDIFALIVGADNQTTEYELAYVRSYLKSLHPPENAEELFDLFAEKVAARLDATATIETLKAKYVYEDAIFLLWKAFELLGVDGILPAELAMARAIGRALGLREPDLRLIESCNSAAGSESRVAEPLSVIFQLNVSDLEAPAGIRLPLEGLRVEIFAFGDRYYVRQRDAVNPVRLGGRSFPTNFLIRFRRDETLAIGPFEFRHVDVAFYFRRLAKCGESRILYIRPEGFSVGVYESPPQDAALRLGLSGLTIQASALQGSHSVTVNGASLTGTAALIPGDAVFIGNTPVDLRRVLLHYVTDSFDFCSGVDSCRISNAPDADLHVADDVRLRWSARIWRQDGGLYFERGDCPHTILRSGRLLDEETELTSGDELRVGIQRIAIELGNDQAMPRLRCLPRGVETYAAENVSYTFSDRSPALDSISFEARRGELVCILGPSGCGKSTLLNVLTGVLVPRVGEVRINAAALRTNGQLQNRIGYVPQDDLLFENLTVFENLYFGARLRCPHLSSRAVEAIAERVLREIALRDRRDIRAGSPTDKTLSGGERKRLNIGLELVSENDILLLDEPISGLSSHDASKIIELLRQRTLRGDIIFVVAHQPSARLLQMFDKLLMLDKGGKLAFFGGIDAAFSYFDAYDSPGLEPSSNQRKPGDPAQLLEALERARSRIDGTPDEERQHTPAYWQSKFAVYRAERFPAVRKGERVPFSDCEIGDRRRRMVQFLAGMRRELTNKFRSRGNLVVSFITAAGLAAVVGLACRAVSLTGAGDYRLNDNPALSSFLFLSVIVAQFFALAGSVQEIVKDRAILLRERMLKIPSSFYLTSKFCTSMIVLAAQLVIYAVIAFWLLKMNELHLLYWSMLCIVGAVGVAGGLLISALPAITEKMASSVIPILLVPQIIFGGGEPFPFERMAHLTWPRDAREAVRLEHRAPLVAIVMPSRWGYEALLCFEREFTQEFKLAREYLEAQHALAALDSPTAASRHQEFFGSSVGDQKKSEWEKQWQNAKRALAGDVPTFVAETEYLVAYKKLPFIAQLKSTIYYNVGVLCLMVAGLLSITLALLHFSRQLDAGARAAGEMFKRTYRRLRGASA